MSSEHGPSDIISNDYLAETAVIGLIVDCRPTATTPRDNFEQARTTEGNIVEDFTISANDANIFKVELNEPFAKIREYKQQNTQNYLTETISEKIISASSYVVEKKVIKHMLLYSTVRL